MIPNHPQFLEAIQEKKKVSVRFYSQADSGVIDRICCPLDYGPGNEAANDLNRYWFWDCAIGAKAPTFGLTSQQIVELRVLGEEFEPGQLVLPKAAWSIPRAWSNPPPVGVIVAPSKPAVTT